MGYHKTLKLDDLSIWSDNSRHFTENLTLIGVSEVEIINILIDVVGEEKMFNLAADIVASKGLMRNIFPIIVETNGKYLVYDGNRRISSLKLLKNPDIIEGHVFKEKIRNLVRACDDLSFIDNVSVYITDENEALELMDKTHNGEQEGVGLIPWEAFQRDGSLVKRGQEAKYPISYSIANIMEFSKKSHFLIPYTDLNRLFSSEKLRTCFGIKELTEKYKKNISYAINSLINYKQDKHFRSFSRHFNITNTSEEDSPINAFCKWAKQQEENKNSIKFASNALSLFKGQKYDFSLHRFKILDSNNQTIQYKLDELQVKHINPDNEEVDYVDTNEVGVWKIQIVYKEHTYIEKVEIKELLKPKIDFDQSNISIEYGNTLNLRGLVLRAFDGYGNDVKSKVSIMPLESANIVDDVFNSNNTIGDYRIQFSFEDVTGAPFSIVKTIKVVDGSKPLSASETTSPLLSFNGNVSDINISPEVNELIEEINSLNYSKYKGILVVTLRAVVELTFDKLETASIISFSSSKDLKMRFEDFKKFLMSNQLNILCSKHSKVLSSYHSELNSLNLMDSTEIASFLNLATHKSLMRIDSTKTVELCKSAISPILVYSSLLLK